MSKDKTITERKCPEEMRKTTKKKKVKEEKKSIQWKFP